MAPSEQYPSNISRPAIGTLAEKSLHAALKRWYARPGDRVEEIIEGYAIDIVRDDGLIEIQTRGFAALKPKLARLLDRYPIRIVYPVAQEKWIVRMTGDLTATLSRRRSPKRGTVMQIFAELVSFPTLISHPHLSLEVALVRTEEIRRDDGRGSWRRQGWSLYDHRLLEIVGRVGFTSAQDFHALLPAALSRPFDAHDLAAAVKQPAPLARKMIYCLREMGILRESGKRGRSRLYREAEIEG